jgi:hypothetical protein
MKSLIELVTKTCFPWLTNIKFLPKNIFISSISFPLYTSDILRVLKPKRIVDILSAIPLLECLLGIKNKRFSDKKWTYKQLAAVIIKFW